MSFGNRLPCEEKFGQTLGFATPAFAGCAFFCTDTPLAHDAQIKLAKLYEPVVPGTWNLIGSSAQQVISATHKLQHSSAEMFPFISHIFAQNSFVIFVRTV